MYKLVSLLRNGKECLFFLIKKEGEGVVFMEGKEGVSILKKGRRSLSLFLEGTGRFLSFLEEERERTSLLKQGTLSLFF